MIKYIIIIFLTTIILSGSTFKHSSNVEEFHVKIVGLEKVEYFKNKFPMIVNNREVYIAYLQQYYNGHEEDFISLLK